MRVRYVVSFVSVNPDINFALVTVMLYAISYCIGQRWETWSSYNKVTQYFVCWWFQRQLEAKLSQQSALLQSQRQMSEDSIRHLQLKLTSLAEVTTKSIFKSLVPGGFDYSLKLVNFKFISMINILNIFCEIVMT